MRIGEAVGQAGTTAKAIRYYESIGLIREAERTAAGYRDYGPDDVERLIFIRSTQRLGFSLDEIREVLAFRERDAQPCGYVRDAVRRRTAAIDRQVHELLALRTELTALAARARDADDGHSTWCRLVESSRRGA